MVIYHRKSTSAFRQSNLALCFANGNTRFHSVHMGSCIFQLFEVPLITILIDTMPTNIATAQTSIIVTGGNGYMRITIISICLATWETPC